MSTKSEKKDCTYSTGSYLILIYKRVGGRTTDTDTTSTIEVKLTVLYEYFEYDGRKMKETSNR